LATDILSDLRSKRFVPMRWCHIVGLLIIGARATSMAQPVPEREPPLHMLVAEPAGATSDVVARLLAEPLRQSLARPVLVENVPGASGRIAASALKRARPDGATVLLAPVIVPVIGPLVFRHLSYNPTRDFAPVSQVTSYELAFAVAANDPAKDVAGFVGWARANPLPTIYGTPAAGSLPHFLGVALAAATGISLEHVAYPGIAKVGAALVGGQIAVGIGAVPGLAALHRAGRIRILATSGPIRSAVLPDVPTFREQGFASIEATGWHAIYAPADTPSSTIDQLSKAVIAALAAPELRTRIAALGLRPTGTDAAQLAAIMASDTAHWAPIIKASGFNTD